jgi:ATP-dependent DNA helicase RecG
MNTTIEELERWMHAPKETEHLEFKKVDSPTFDNTRLYRYCVAIANEGGGKLILGVTNKVPRVVVGTNSFNYPDGMKNKIFDKLHFVVEVEELKHPDGRVVIFHIPPRPRGMAYSLEGAYWMRVGEELRAMSDDRLREIHNEGRPDWLMETARGGCKESDVIRLLDTQSYFDLLKLPYPATRDPVIEKFCSEKLIINHGLTFSITNLGAILFAKKLDEFEGVYRKAVRVVVYGGANKLETSRLIGPGIKGYAVSFESLIEFINSQLPSNEVFGTALRTEVKMFPQVAIRELVANALIHQDFNETGTCVTIDIYSDRLEISNPGVPIISPDRFIDEYQSRNEKLADLMRRFGICEEQGKGIDKVVNAAEVFQLPAPDFRVGERRTQAILFAHKDFEAMDGKDRVRACYQHCALRFLTNQKMDNQSLRERFKLPENRSETVSRIIRDAIEQGRIKPDDPANTSKRYAKYVPWWA